VSALFFENSDWWHEYDHQETPAVSRLRKDKVIKRKGKSLGMKE